MITKFLIFPPIDKSSNITTAFETTFILPVSEIESIIHIPVITLHGSNL